MKIVLAWVAAALLVPVGAAAQMEPPAGTPSSAVPAAMREIGFDQNLNQPMPLDVPFVDSTGKAVTLGDYFGERPVVLSLVYYNCAMLCSQVMNAMANTFAALSLEPGKDFEVVTISFDPREKPPLAAMKKAETLTHFTNPAAPAAWHFLTGDQAAIDRVTKAAGFRYVWDQATDQYAHPTGIIVLTPQGRIARYLFGIEYGARDLRLALVEASSGGIGNPVDSLLLACYHYDPKTGRYDFAVQNALRVGGGLTILFLVGGIVYMIRQEKKGHA